jgi:hypothetical protein
MHIKQQGEREITRETYETDSRGRPMMVRITARGVFTWPKGTRGDVEQVSLVAAHEGAKRRRMPLPEGRQLGMSARKRTPRTRGES